MRGPKTHWFLPEEPDVMGMLRAQAAATIDGMDALVAWASGEAAGADRVRVCEHAADERKRSLQKALRTAFTTPVDAEDLYALSQRLDAVMNGAKDAVRESEVMAIPPDEAVAAMATHLAEGVRHLNEAFERMGSPARPRGGDGLPTDAADEAVKSQRHLERVYRAAMSSLLEVADLREVMGRRELYRRLSRVSETLIEVAERVWYAFVKES